MSEIPDIRTDADNQPLLEEKYAGPIYLTKWYRFFPDIDSAVDFVYDEGEDPAKAEAHQCSAGQAHTPSIYDYITEAWWEQYEDDPGVDMSKEAEALCEQLQKLLEAEAPIMWTPLRDRIQLPAVDESKVVRLLDANPRDGA